MKHYRPFCFTGALLSSAIIFSLSASNVLAQNSPPKPDDNADVRAAFQFMQRQMTIDTNAFGAPEAGLARIEAISDDLCKLRCGYHFAVSLNDVVDAEFEFALDKMARRTLTWEIDKNGRGAISFKSSTGASDFRARGRARKADILMATPKPSAWSKWSEWKATDAVTCRAKPDKVDLARLLRAINVIASFCGAKDTPF